MLEAGKIGNCKDLSKFDKGQIGQKKWPDYWVKASPQLQLLWGVPGLQWSVSIKSGPRKEYLTELVTGSWAARAH